MLDKNVLIGKVDQIKADVGEKGMAALFGGGESEDGSKKDKMGSNQFRELAAICARIECYEELELLIKYNISKDSKHAGWNYKCDNAESFGMNVIKQMKEVYEADKADHKKNLELLFGYLYRKHGIVYAMISHAALHIVSRVIWAVFI